MEIKNVVFLVDPDSLLSPEEKVFSIDHVLELIFHDIDKTSLLSSRLVSRRWSYFAAKALQNTVHISFYGMNKRAPSGTGLFSFKTNERRPVQDLVDLLNNSTEFPCTSFYFGNCTSQIITPIIEPFFREHASQLKKLKLEGVFSSEDLKHLICTRALNLKEFQLKDVQVNEHGKSDMPLLNTYPLLGERLTQPEPVVLKNLKIFTCDNPIPDNIIHQILESALNLSQVFLHHQNLPCLVKPTNRLHLVKILVIGFVRKDAISLLKLIADNLRNNQAVQQIQISGLDEYLETPSPNLVEAMRKLLEGCSGTCTKLALFNFIENFQIPLMPQVKDFTFRFRKKANGSPRYIFQEGTSLQNTFPNLQYLKILSGYENLSDTSIPNILGKDDHLLPFPNVKDVKLCFRDTPYQLFESFREIFPYADVYT